MVEELKLVLEMVGTASEMGMWAFVIYLSYGLLSKIVGWGSFIFVIWLITQLIRYAITRASESD